MIRIHVFQVVLDRNGVCSFIQIISNYLPTAQLSDVHVAADMIHHNNINGCHKKTGEDVQVIETCFITHAL